MRNRSSRLRAALATLVTASLVVTMQQQPAFAAKPKPYTPPKAAQQPSIPVRKVTALPSAARRQPQAANRPAPVWPSAGSADATLSTPTGTPISFHPPIAPQKRATTKGTAKSSSVGNTGTAAPGTRAAQPAKPPARMHVDVLDQAEAARAGVPGLLFRVRRGDGSTDAAPVGVTVDYGRFATAYGADWATRLRLVRLPECALTTPGQKQCQGTALPTYNDTAHKRASADVTVGGTATQSAPTRSAPTQAGATRSAVTPAAAGQLIALTAAPNGNSGSYGATKLSPSGVWSAGGSSGNFSWSYPMRVPPAMDGPVPTLELAYSAQSVDGRMVASNNQPSEVGEGFELGTGGFIERRYKTCSDDTKNGANNAGDPDKNADDQCWGTDNATLSLNGSGGDLIQDASNPDLWHLRNDDGSRIEHRTGATNGARNGEWWVVTTPNGTQYWFGRNQLPGFTSGTTTNSTWTVPVFGNHTNEPCHQSTFAASSCTQAWRWNLDYVVDPHGNTMSYWYKTESNNYQTLNGPVRSYIRSGYLDHVSYGTRVEPDLATGKDTIFTGHAAAQVAFAYDDRCLSGCTTHDATHWPDTPWDLACTSSTSCLTRMPSFFTTRRLTTITTSTYAGGGTFRDVERWTLTHSYPDPQDGTRAGLWLDKVGHTGLVGTATPLPDVTFVGKPMPNRVDAVDNAPAMNWMRLTDINTETGAIVHVDYLDTDCVAGQTGSISPENNTKRCYPVRWTPPGFPEQTDYFNRYVVNEVTETDRTGGSPRVLHHYSYLTPPAWHYTDDDGLISDNAKTWSQWRGYGRVGVTTGDPGGQTYTETTFFRGMNGDHLSSGTRSVSVTDSQGGSVPDEDAYAGMTRETRTFLGPGGAEVSGEIHDPWQSAPNATRSINGTTVYARYTNTEGTHSRVTLDHAPWVRRTYTKSTFDQYGMVVKEDDYGDETVTGDEQCMITTFEPRNTSLWLMTLPQRIQTFAVDCAKAAGTLTDDDVIGDARTLYDGHQTYGVAPAKGDVTQVDQMSAYNSGSPTYVTVSRTAYDDLGRPVESWDALDRHSATAYTPNDRTGPVTQTVDTNPMGWTTTTTVEPAWGLATRTTDVNNLTTNLRYDGLGRLTKVWLPGRDPATDTPDTAYDYTIRTNGVNAVTTSHLNPKGGVTKSYTLYDGLLRTRQTQTASSAGGRILADTFYDAAGREVLNYGAYYDRTGAPGVDLVQPLTQDLIPNQTATVYDGAGRVTASIFQPKNHERWRTTTVYGGDHTDVEPPNGATARSTWTDARQRTAQLRQYPTRSATGTDYDHTDYTYNRKGLLDSVTTPDGSRWTYGYDPRGRQTSSTDPDGGKTTMRYDNAGRLTSTTDANSSSLAYYYDALDRKISMWKGTTATSGNQLAQWDYDQATFDQTTTPVLGQLYQSSRIDTKYRYVRKVDHYDKRYRPSSNTVTIPSSETGLAGSYTFTTGYNLDGSVSGTSYPATGDLQRETVLYGYTDFDQPLNLMDLYGTSGVETSLVTDSQYDALAHPTQYTLYTGWFSSLGSRAYLSYETDQTTGRLNEISVHRDGVAPNTVTDMHYTYDDAGNVTKIADTPTGGGYTDLQCFSYDRYQRLREAWTPTADDCATAPSATALGGPAPYWQSYTYTLGGARQQLVDHATAKGDVSTTYQYTDSTPTDPTTGQPHALRGTTTTDNTGTRTAAYTYDKAGNTRTRPGPNGTQTLVWDVEGNLQSVTDAAGTISYVYDADGNRLVSRDTTGRTLYLPGEELRYTNSTATTSCTRYYSFGDGTVAQRTAAGLSWLASDHQGTQDVSLDEKTQAATIRRQTPFGTARGAAPTWVNDKGFVGGTTDPTGLTHLGAREYDPGLGRFISVDPVLDTGDPQSMEGYAYGDNSPIVRADPSGQRPSVMGDSGGGGSGADNSTPQSDPPPANPPKPKHCGWRCKAGHAVTRGVNWADDHKAVIAGVATGIVVGVGCEVATGGVGTVACAAAGGAAASMVQYSIETAVEHKGNFSIGGMLKEGAVGAIVGGVTAGLGSVGTAGIKAGISSTLSGAGARAALSAGRAAMKKEAGSVLGGLTRSAFTRSASRSAEGAAGGAGSKLAKAAESCEQHSFAAGTAVLMADGTTRAIQNVKVGDKVLASDPETGERSARDVTALHNNHDRDLADVTVKDARTGARTILHTTWHHPFWSANKQAWVDATDLVTGDQLRDANGRTSKIVVAVKTWTGLHWMHDLTVADVHTYYVMAGTTPVLVHNCGGAEVPNFSAYPREFLDQAAKYGKAGVRELPDGRVRFYGEIAEARTPGEMVGRRLVREWNPGNGATRIWHETLDHAENVRIVRPDVTATGGRKVHYMFDDGGSYTGSW